MKRFWITLLKIYLFWLIFFAIGRTIFLCVYHHLLVGIDFIEILKTYIAAWRLDTAMACYFCVLPIILSALQLCIKGKILFYLQMIVCGIELFFANLVLFGEIGVYKEWLTKLNYKIFLYLKHPTEIVQSANSVELLLFFVGLAVLMVIFLWIYRRWVLKPEITCINKKLLKFPLCFCLSGGLCFLGMRGGFDAIPITQSAAYFSRHTILNDVAVNPDFNLIMHFINFKSVDKNKFHFMDNEQAEAVFKQIHFTEKDSNINILKTNNINIVIILLESWSADLVDDLTGRKDSITPNFQKLEKEGILFTNMYANGHRSQQAVCSILSGFPSVPIFDITDNQEKYKHLPSLIQPLQQNGYATSFYFGGNLDYGNIRAFLLHCNFDKIVESKDLPKKLPRGKLGIPDQYMTDIHINSLTETQEPFFSVWFTVSTHSPYDQPKNTPQVKNENLENLAYLNSAKYCDFWLGKYFEKVRQEPWYANTLFILVGDHGHPTHLQQESAMNFNYQRVPMLWLGEVLKDEYKGSINSDMCSHIDLAKTILSQLNINNDNFLFGRNIYNANHQQFAFFEALEGFGYKIPHGSIVQFNTESAFIQNFEGDSAYFDTIKQQGEAFLQYLYQTYMDY